MKSINYNHHMPSKLYKMGTKGKGRGGKKVAGLNLGFQEPTFPKAGPKFKGKKRK